jgi:hypothetical protein
MQGRFLAKIVVALAVMTVVLLHDRPAFAEDQVAQLSKQLETSSSDKERISAVVALARLRDRRTMKPLVAALHDPSSQVRALAATALGELGHKAALPSLRHCADDDTDDNVRHLARTAAIAVAKANHLPSEVKLEPARPGFGHDAHAVEHPDLCVTIRSSSDDSPGGNDKKTRDTHAAIVKQVLADSFKNTPQVTTALTEAERWGLDPRHIDLSVVKMDVTDIKGMIEVNAELRLAVSDDKGRMLSFLSGGAKVTVPKAKFDMRYLPNLRKEALENAMRGMFDKLLVHLRSQS